MLRPMSRLPGHIPADNVNPLISSLAPKIILPSCPARLTAVSFSRWWAPLLLRYIPRDLPHDCPP